MRKITNYKTHISNNIIIDENNCWIWKKRRNKDGYGCIWYKNREELVHRASYIEFNGEIGEYFVLHKCDTPACCNPEHLFLGTQYDNNYDCKRKGRSSCGIGERNKHVKLQEFEVLEIIEKYKTGKYYQKDLAVEYGINNRQISNIVTGKSWKHLQEV